MSAPVSYGGFDGKRLRIVVDADTVFLCCEEMRGRQHKYCTVELPENLSRPVLLKLLAELHESVDKAFES